MTQESNNMEHYHHYFESPILTDEACSECTLKAFYSELLHDDVPYTADYGHGPQHYVNRPHPQNKNFGKKFYNVRVAKIIAVQVLSDEERVQLHRYCTCEAERLGRSDLCTELSGCIDGDIPRADIIIEARRRMNESSIVARFLNWFR